MLWPGVFDVLNQTQVKKALSFEWMGQTIASVSWIVSVFVYGFSNGDGTLEMGTGDWLQLLAASSWLISNIASLVNAGKNEPKTVG
ncbi:MAG: hypothetical protein CMA67_03220 [Euryarchaeota archaeon]|nr:hypothetical protein [Euryarchaeota archaeon]